jgi:hypothetical protein
MQRLWFWQVSRRDRRFCWRNCIVLSVILLLAHLSPATLLNQSKDAVQVTSSLAADIIQMIESVRQLVLVGTRPTLAALFVCLLFFQFEKTPNSVRVFLFPLRIPIYLGIVASVGLYLTYLALLCIERTSIGLLITLMSAIGLFTTNNIIRNRPSLTSHDSTNSASLLEVFVAGASATVYAIYLLS